MSARKPLLDALVSMLTPRDVLVSCLGANARYLPHMEVPSPVFALCDSMGAAIPLALGMALQRPDRHLVALEGDGSLLMSPNVLATVAAVRPPNLSILLWVNGRYESSGGQALPPAVKEFLRYVLSRDGQDPILYSGYFPLSAQEADTELAKLE